MFLWPTLLGERAAVPTCSPLFRERGQNRVFCGASGGEGSLALSLRARALRESFSLPRRKEGKVSRHFLYLQKLPLVHPTVTHPSEALVCTAMLS